MKPIRSLAAGVWPALLAAFALLGSACVVDQTDEPIEDVDDVAETDHQLHGPTAEHGGTFGDGQGADDEDDDFLDGEDWSDERDQHQGVVIPGTVVSEPEPDPWDDPMKSGQDGSNGSGNKD